MNYEPSARDYKNEDEYINLCVVCHEYFLGNKKRWLCKKCSEIPNIGDK